jgi:hypothetical protein
MSAMNYYDVGQSSAGPFSTLNPAGKWCKRSDVEKLLGQFPDGMEHCTFEVVECPQGHTRLSATNLVDHGCMKCANDKLQYALNEARAQALAAIQLIPEDVGIGTLRGLAKEARDVFMGKYKETISELQDEINSLRERVTRPPCPGVNTVYGVDPATPDVRVTLPLLMVHRDVNGGLVLEVQLP